GPSIGPRTWTSPCVPGGTPSSPTGRHSSGRGSMNNPGAPGRLGPMAVDYRRLGEGLGAAAALINRGGGLAAIEALVGALRDATGAAGATFTEYTADAGRVVVACGELAWALGQPVGGQFIDEEQPLGPWASRIETLPPPIAEPLLARGVLGITGHPVRTRR